MSFGIRKRLMVDLQKIRSQIDDSESDNEIRAALANAIMEFVAARGDHLTPWERMHLGVAADLLPSDWLRMTWAHLNCVYNPCECETHANDWAPVDWIPTKEELRGKLNVAASLISA